MGGNGRESNALKNAGTGQMENAQLYNNANNLYGVTVPQLTSMAENPQGYGPATKAKMNTAAQQSAGGSQAAATGQGALQAARTNNPGSSAASTAESARTAGQQLSQDALGVETADANLKNQQQQSALSGLEGLYGTTLGGSLGALNASNSAISAANSASGNSFWKNLLNSAASGLFRG